MEDEDKAMRMMPSGWGAPEVFFQKYLRAQKSNPDPSLEDVLSAEEGMKTPRTRDEFIRQNNLPLDYFTTDNNTRAKYNDEWRKRKALALPKKPELYPGSKDIPQPVTTDYPLPPIQFDLSKIPGYQEGGPVERTDNTKVASGRPQQVQNRIPWGAGKGPAGEGPMRLFNDPYVNMGLMAMGPIVGKFKPGETPPQHINGVKQAPPTLQDIMNYLQQSPKVPDNARAMGLGVHGLSRRSGKSPQEVIKIMSQKFGAPQTYPKAFDNSEPAYGWTFENPDQYRQALQLFNLK